MVPKKYYPLCKGVTAVQNSFVKTDNYVRHKKCTIEKFRFWKCLNNNNNRSYFRCEKINHNENA